MTVLWNNALNRFGLPRVTVVNNGSQLISARLRNLCSEWKINILYSTPRHPQENGQAEATNKTILNTLKKRLEKANGRWAEEFLGVLWPNRMTEHKPTTNHCSCWYTESKL